MTKDEAFTEFMHGIHCYAVEACAHSKDKQMASMALAFAIGYKLIPLEPVSVPRIGYGLSEYQAELLTRHKPIADFYEWFVHVMELEPKRVANAIVQNFPKFKRILGEA